MAVYTYLSDSDIQLLGKQSYGLDIKSVKPIAEGIENSIYQLESVSHEFYALVIFESISAPLVESYCHIFDQVHQKLETSGLEVLVPAGRALLQAQEQYRFAGAVVSSEDSVSKPLVIQPWIAGDPVKPSNALCLQLGQVLGVVNTIRPQITTTALLGQADHQGLPINQHLLRIDLVEASLDEMEQSVQQQFWQMKQAVLPLMEAHHTLSYGLVHGDLFSDNALAEGQNLTGVIDFFNASWSPVLLDLAICLMDWCYENGQFHEGRTLALLAGFREKCDLVPSFDIETWPELVRLAAFRFWCTRQEYYLACAKRNVAPVDNRAPSFCAQVFNQAQVQAQFLQDALAG